MQISGLSSSLKLTRARPVAASQPQDVLLPGRTATETIQAIVDQEKLRVLAGTVQKGCESIFLPQTGHAKGTVLLFHGYTAGPWQYRELAQRFHDAGYHVFAPRMPGHGDMENGVPTGKSLPDPKGWLKFVDDTHALAASLKCAIQAIGLSGGANVALCMGERHKLAGVGAMAPYLGGDMPKGILFTLSDVLDRCSFGLFGRLVLSRIPWKKNVAIPNDPTPHTQGTMGQARSMRRLGAAIKEVKCPVQLISTDGDALSGVSRVRGMARRALQTGWYRFAQSEKVPHAMLSPQENKNPSSVSTVHDILFRFVEHGTYANR